MLNSVHSLNTLTELRALPDSQGRSVLRKHPKFIRVARSLYPRYFTQKVPYTMFLLIHKHHHQADHTLHLSLQLSIWYCGVPEQGTALMRWQFRLLWWCCMVLLSMVYGEFVYSTLCSLTDDILRRRTAHFPCKQWFIALSYPSTSHWMVNRTIQVTMTVLYSASGRGVQWVCILCPLLSYGW